MIRAFAVSLLTLLILPAAALAQTATVSISGTQITYAGSNVRDAFFLTRGNPPALLFDRNGGDTKLVPGNGCGDVFGNGTRLLCQVVGGATINLNDGDDWFSGGSDGVGMTVNGGSGNDFILSGGFAQRTLNGGSGADTFNLAGSANTDWVDGGADDDTILYPKGSDDLRGGAGTDGVEFVNGVAVSVTLDDKANDGAGNDIPINVHADVENLVGGDQADAFTGSAAANVLDGGKGNDALDGGAGADTLRGGDGDDQIEAQDGVKDTVECGLGNDRATIDEIDTVSGCETVVRPDEVKPPPGDDPKEEEDKVVVVVEPPAQILPLGDFDHDGVLAGADCRDTDPAIRPGAADTPGDGVDQDCSGADAPYPRLTAKLTYGYAAAGRNTVLTALELREIQDATVELRCSGCTVRKKLAKASGVVKLTSAVKGRKLRPGVVITVTISRPGYVSEVRRLTMRASKKPTLTALCQAPGATKPSAC